MSTKKPRINITLDNKLYLLLKKLADKKNTSLPILTLDLIKNSLETEEDIYFSKKTDERLSLNEKRVSHSKVWK